jgi:Dockerin type I domain
MEKYSTMRLCLRFGVAALALLCGPLPFAVGAFHLWHVKEVFTNASGTVQFIEMFDSFSGENYVSDMVLSADSDGVVKNFSFPDVVDTSIDSAGRHILIATSGFDALPGGIAPDFTFAQGGVTGSFFNPNATNITITFFGSGDGLSFTGASLPKDGINSLEDSNATGLPFLSTPNISPGLNSPTNFHNEEGEVNLSTPSPTGDYNGNNVVDAADYAVWRKMLNSTVTQAGTGADGDSSGTIDAGDYTYWRARFGNPAGSGSLGGGSVPEPALAALPLSGLLLLLRRLRLSRAVS